MVKAYRSFKARQNLARYIQESENGVHSRQKSQMQEIFCCLFVLQLAQPTWRMKDVVSVEGFQPYAPIRHYRKDIYFTTFDTSSHGWLTKELEVLSLR